MAITRLGPNQLVNLASNVTGTLPTANGGTGATSFTAGKVLQVVQSTNNYQKSSSSTSMQDIESSSGTIWEPAITLSSASSKLYVLADINWYTEGTSTTSDQRFYLRMHKKIGSGSYSAVVNTPYSGLYYYVAVKNDAANFVHNFKQLITINSTDEVKIKFDYKSLSSSGYNLVINYGTTSTCTLMEVSA